MLDVEFLHKEVGYRRSYKAGEIQGNKDVKIGVVDNAVCAQNRNEYNPADGDYIVPGGRKSNCKKQELVDDGTFTKMSLVGKVIDDPDCTPQHRKDRQVGGDGHNFVVGGLSAKDGESRCYDQREQTHGQNFPGCVSENLTVRNEVGYHAEGCDDCNPKSEPVVEQVLGLIKFLGVDIYWQ